MVSMNVIHELAPGEVIREREQAWFYSEAPGELTVTDRRLLFRAFWDSGMLRLSVPLNGIAQCSDEGGGPLLGRKLIVNLRDSTFPLRFNLHDAKREDSMSLVAAINTVVASPFRQAAEAASQLKVTLGDGVFERVRTTPGGVYVWCKPILRGNGFKVEAKREPRERIEFVRWQDEMRFPLFLSAELLYFNELEITTQHGVFWAETPSANG